MQYEKVIERKIKFGDKELTASANPYQLVLKDNVYLQLTIADHTFDEIHELVNNTENIDFYTKTQTIEIDDETGKETVVSEGEWTLQESYWGYTCGETGFVSNYENGTFKIQLTRKNENLVQLENNTSDITNIQLAIAELAESMEV